MKDEDTWKRTEELIEKISLEICEELRILKRKEGQTLGKLNFNDTKLIQRAYRINRKNVMRELMGERKQQVPFMGSGLYGYFKEEWKVKIVRDIYLDLPKFSPIKMKPTNQE